MTDTTAQNLTALRPEFARWDVYPAPPPPDALVWWDTNAMADEIVRLRAAIARVRALHGEGFTRGCCKTCKGYDSFDVPLPCPTLRALDRDA